MATNLNMTLLLRRGAFADSYVLKAGEPGYHTGTGALKIGDGTKTWVELPFANQAQIEALIKVVDDKVANLNDTYATDAEVKVIKEALEAAIAGVKATADAAAEKLEGISEGANKVEKSETNGNIKIDGVETVVYTHPAKHIIADIEGLQEALEGKADGIEGGYAQEKHVHVKADITDFAHTHAASEVTDLDATIKGYDYATKAEAQAMADGKDAAIADAKKAGTDAAAALDAYKTTVTDALALKADKAAVDAMYTNAQIDSFIAAAKKYADDNDADTKYGITYDSDAKKIKLIEGGTALEIDATDFIKDGMIENVTIGDDNDLVITFNTDAGKQDIKLPLDQLVDIYTGAEGARVTVSVSSDKKVSADLVAGSITKNYLDSDVQTSLGKADTALQAADLADYAKTADVNTAISNAVAPKLDTVTFNNYIDGKSMSDADLKKYAEDEADAAEAAAKKYTDDELAEAVADLQAQIDGKQDAGNFDGAGSADAAEANAKAYADQKVADFKTNTVDPIDARVKAIEDAPYTTKKYVDDQDADMLAQAKAYADAKEHKNTTYTVAPTENILEFTVTPSEGDVQTIKLVSPTIDTGIMNVVAGKTNSDIAISAENGIVTVSHKDYQTGTVKDAAHDSATDPSFVTGISIENGHVTGATVRNLAEVLGAMEFILDGGTAE
jgi:hypothetical protein